MKSHGYFTLLYRPVKLREPIENSFSSSFGMASRLSVRSRDMKESSGSRNLLGDLNSTMSLKRSLRMSPVGSTASTCHLFGHGVAGEQDTPHHGSSNIATLTFCKFPI